MAKAQKPQELKAQKPSRSREDKPGDDPVHHGEPVRRRSFLRGHHSAVAETLQRGRAVPATQRADDGELQGRRWRQSHKRTLSKPG